MKIAIPAQEMAEALETKDSPFLNAFIEAENKGISDIYNDISLHLHTNEQCQKGIHNWDEMGDKCMTCGVDYLTFLGNFNDALTKCECGAASTSFPEWHSTWCPKYKEAK